MESQATSIQVFPNPFIETLYVNLPENEDVNSVIISDQTGRINNVPYQIADQRVILNLGGIGSGAYVVKILTSNRIYSTKAIKIGSR